LALRQPLRELEFGLERQVQVGDVRNGDRFHR
jgi:hypothetical protein